MTDEQRKAVEWAIGMASQHNIHKSPLRELLASSPAAPSPAQTERCYAPSCGKWDGNDTCTCARAALQAAPAAENAAPAQSAEPVAWRDAIKSYPSPDMTLAPQPSPTAVDEANAKRFPTPISISTDKICELAGKYNLGNPRIDALRGFVNEVIIVNEAEYAKSE